MKKISLKLVFIIAVVFSVAFGSEISAGEKKPVIPESLVSFVVVKDYNGKPIHNAGVVMHPVNEKGKAGERRPGAKDGRGRQGQLRRHPLWEVADTGSGARLSNVRRRFRRE